MLLQKWETTNCEIITTTTTTTTETTTTMTTTIATNLEGSDPACLAVS